MSNKALLESVKALAEHVAQMESQDITVFLPRGLALAMAKAGDLKPELAKVVLDLENDEDFDGLHITSTVSMK